jgi:hypothetical protein
MNENVKKWQSYKLGLFIHWDLYSMDGVSCWGMFSTPYDKDEYRVFKNSDAKVLTEIYNDSLLPHFRPFLGRDINEFKESIFQGLSYYSEYKYVVEDKNTKNINAVLIINTVDN